MWPAERAVVNKYLELIYDTSLARMMCRQARHPRTLWVLRATRATDDGTRPSVGNKPLSQ